MSKYRRFNDDDEYYDDQFNERAYREQIKERRKLKRMKNALRARRYDDLLFDYDDDQ